MDVSSIVSNLLLAQNNPVLSAIAGNLPLIKTGINVIKKANTARKIIAVTDKLGITGNRHLTEEEVEGIYNASLKTSKEATKLVKEISVLEDHSKTIINNIEYMINSLESTKHLLDEVEIELRELEIAENKRLFANEKEGIQSILISTENDISPIQISNFADIPQTPIERTIVSPTTKALPARPAPQDGVINSSKLTYEQKAIQDRNIAMNTLSELDEIFKNWHNQNVLVKKYRSQNLDFNSNANFVEKLFAKPVLKIDSLQNTYTTKEEKEKRSDRARKFITLEAWLYGESLHDNWSIDSIERQSLILQRIRSIPFLIDKKFITMEEGMALIYPYTARDDKNNRLQVFNKSIKVIALKEINDIYKTIKDSIMVNKNVPYKSSGGQSLVYGDNILYTRKSFADGPRDGKSAQLRDDVLDFGEYFGFTEFQKRKEILHNMVLNKSIENKGDFSSYVNTFSSQFIIESYENELIYSSHLKGLKAEYVNLLSKNSEFENSIEITDSNKPYKIMLAYSFISSTFFKNSFGSIDERYFKTIGDFYDSIAMAKGLLDEASEQLKMMDQIFKKSEYNNSVISFINSITMNGNFFSRDKVDINGGKILADYFLIINLTKDAIEYASEKIYSNPALSEGQKKLLFNTFMESYKYILQNADSIQSMVIIYNFTQNT